MVEDDRKTSQKSTAAKPTRKTYDKAKQKRNGDIPTVYNTHNQFITPEILNEGYAQMITNTPANNLMMTLMNQFGNTYVPVNTQDFTTFMGQTDHLTSEQRMENIMAMQNAILTNYCFGMWMYYNQQMNSNAFPNQSNFCQHNQSANFPSPNSRQTRNVYERYNIPMELGWTRKVLVQSIVNGNITGTVTYISPEGQRFSNMSDIDVLLSTGTDLSRENFSFDQNLILGEFFDNSDNLITPVTETELRSKIDYASKEPQMVYNSQRITTEPQVSDYNLMNYLNQIQMSMNCPHITETMNTIVNTPKKKVDIIEPKKPSESANSSTKKCPVKIETSQKDIKTILTTKKLVKAEDLLIKSSKPLFGLRKRCYKGIDPKTIENCLMTIEFSFAFADFIKIDSSDLVSIKDFISFFYGNSDSMKKIINTFIALLRPLLPLDTTNRYYKTICSTLKYYGKHCIVTNNNCSELFSYLLSFGDKTDPHITKMRNKLASQWLFSFQSDEIAWAFAYMVEKLVISTKFSDIIDKTFEDITKLKKVQSQREKQIKMKLENISTEKPKVISSDEHSTLSADSSSSSKKIETVQRVKKPLKPHKNIDTKTEVAKLQRRIRCPLIGHDRFYRGYYIMHSSKAIFVRGVTETENKGELIPEDYKNCWFSIDDLNELKSFNQSINHLGCRESFLERGMHKLYASIYDLLPSKFDSQELPVKPIESFDFSRYPYYELWKWMDDFRTSVIDWFINMTKVPNEEYNLLDSDNEITLLRKCKNYIISIKSSIDTKILRSPFQNENEVFDSQIDQQWRNMVEQAQSCSNLAIFAELLKDSISWDKFYNKMVCQICQDGENDYLILLCDSCNHGFHSYCINPPLHCIPVGDWFCPQCVSNSNIVNGKNCCFVCGKNKEQLIKCTTCTKNVHVDCISNKMTRFSITKWQCNECEGIDSVSPSIKSESKSKRQRRSSFVLDKDMIEYCRQVITKLEEYEEAEAFMTPVDCRRVHQYKKVIEFPMDFSTVMKKLKSSKYISTEDFANDVRLIFDNCEKFNEDSSEIGQDGHFMRNKFDEIWSCGPYFKNN